MQLANAPPPSFQRWEAPRLAAPPMDDQANIPMTKQLLKSIINESIRAYVEHHAPNPDQPTGKRPRTRGSSRDNARLWSRCFSKRDIAMVYRLEPAHALYQEASHFVSAATSIPNWSFREDDKTHSGTSYLIFSDLAGVYSWRGFSVPFTPHTPASGSLQNRLIKFLRSDKPRLSGFNADELNSLMVIHYPFKHGSGRHTDNPADSTRFVANLTLGGRSDLSIYPKTSPKFNIINGEGHFTLFDSHLPHAAGSCDAERWVVSARGMIPPSPPIGQLGNESAGGSTN